MHSFYMNRAGLGRCNSALSSTSLPNGKPFLFFLFPKLHCAGPCLFRSVWCQFQGNTVVIDRDSCRIVERNESLDGGGSECVFVMGVANQKIIFNYRLIGSWLGF